MNLIRPKADSYWAYEIANEVEVPVAKPRLPLAAEILPYLRRMDQSRWYSNSGPLVEELEARLAAHAGGGSVATVANATIGLTLALLASDLTPGALCMVPSWTFAASAHAIQLAGLVPWIVDVDSETWTLESGEARELLHRAPGQVAAVMPVSPFGQPIDCAAWEIFRKETGIAVVIDAAAMFDTIRATSIPTVVSLHATKILGVGEGGFIISSDHSLWQEVQKRANFGFWGTREATARSANGKMSEYTAAVGLAGLANWEATRADFVRVGMRYVEAFSGQSRVKLQEGFGQRWVSTTVNVSVANGGAGEIAQVLSSKGIATRRWWGGGLHQHSAFLDCPRNCTPNTEWLAGTVLGLPCWSDLPNDKIDAICEIVLRASL